MRKLLLLVVLFLVINPSKAQSLKVLGNVLYYISNDGIFEVKRFQHSADFYGYDIIDSNHVFVAYQPEGYAEASSIISVIEVSTGKEQQITELGGTGESFFSYNQKNGKILFNCDGIYTLRIWDKKRKDILKEEPRKIISDTTFTLWKPFWVSSRRIGVLRQDESKTEYYDLKE